jgi:ribosomal protein S18 acetylase RimI-like enzyme
MLMQLEDECFIVELQMEWEDKEWLLERTASCFLAYDKTKIIGEIYAVSEYEEEDIKTDDDQHFFEIIDRCVQEKGAYIYSIGVLPDYEGKDIAKRLLWTTLKDLKDKGFKKSFAHAKKGASEHLFRFFGADVLGYRENWYDTGLPYAIIEIDLDELTLINFQPYIQENNYDCGLACIEAILDYKEVKYDRKKIIEASGLDPGEGTSPNGMIKGLKAGGVSPIIVNNIGGLRAPTIMLVMEPAYYEGHYLVLVGFGKNLVFVQDVDNGRIGRMSLEGLGRMWWNDTVKTSWGVTA